MASLNLEPSTGAYPKLVDPGHGQPRARRIEDTDLEFLAKFFERGLGYPEQYFAFVLKQLKSRAVPDGYPRYGYVLECDGAIVGAILQIFARVPAGSGRPIRCHVTSWCVEPRFRLFASLFFRKALTFKDVTYINVSARPGTKSIIDVQGFKIYSRGQFVALPLMGGVAPAGDRVQILPGDRTPDATFEPEDYELLTDHARFGCIALWCVAEHRAYPFVFQARQFKGFVPGVQLIYCRDLQDLVRFARPLGWHMLSRRKLLIRIDANGPIPGLTGAYFPGMEPRYCKGHAPRLGDLAYTQTVMAPHLRKGDPFQ
jgi:hypothetical protein